MTAPIRALALLSILLPIAAAQPIRLDPKNPHYFLYRGKPVAPISSGEHYGAVINADFDYHRYLATLAADGLNYTRLFPGSYREVPAKSFGIQRNTLAPAPGRFLAPWARSQTPGYAGGGNKFDLDRWDPGFFARFRDFLSAAAERGIIVEITLFSSHYQEMQWKISALYPANNVNGTDAIDWKKLHTLENGNILGHQERYTRKLAREANGFENVIFEIQNEPWSDRPTLAGVVNPYLPLPGRDVYPNSIDLADQLSLAWQARVAGLDLERGAQSAEPASHRAELLQLPIPRAAACAGGEHRQFSLCLSGSGGVELRNRKSHFLRRNRISRPGRRRVPAAGLELHVIRRERVQRPGLFLQRRA